MYNSNIYERRRIRLLDQLEADSLVVLFSSTISTHNHGIPFPFHQNSDFYYLTGFDEPSACAVLEKSGNGKFSYTLFCLPKNKEQERWQGYRAGPEEAINTYGASQSYPAEML
ncbi:unnamed protein product, partial [marine sediment metagenome]